MLIPLWLVAIVLVGLVYLLVTVVRLRHYVLRLKEVVYMLEMGEEKQEKEASFRKPARDTESEMGDTEGEEW